MADKLIGQQQQQQLAVICGMPYRRTVTTVVVGTTLWTIVFIVTVISSTLAVVVVDLVVLVRRARLKCSVKREYKVPYSIYSIIDQADLYCLCWLASCELISYWLFAIMSYIYHIYIFRSIQTFIFTEFLPLNYWISNKQIN